MSVLRVHLDRSEGVRRSRQERKFKPRFGNDTEDFEQPCEVFFEASYVVGNQDAVVSDRMCVCVYVLRVLANLRMLYNHACVYFSRMNDLKR